MGTNMPAILVVDDDPIHAEFLVALLQRSGREAHLASSAEQALRRLAQGDIGTVITDLLMPEADGIELLRAIRRAYPDIRVIGVTGCDPWLRHTAGQVMTHFGLQELLPKPIDAAALQQALNHSPTSDSKGEST
jgi:two-component system, cell cycle response regulator CpdR